MSLTITIVRLKWQRYLIDDDGLWFRNIAQTNNLSNVFRAGQAFNQELS